MSDPNTVPRWLVELAGDAFVWRYLAAGGDNQDGEAVIVDGEVIE